MKGLRAIESRIGDDKGGQAAAQGKDEGDNHNSWDGYGRNGMCGDARQRASQPLENQINPYTPRG